ncbi:MAG: hypothetical protein SOV16_08545 [Anaerobiospirillum succiniciproducens]|uniref:hypothetical protein n=1 Tax=Anaerobiospirillum succiniciproducens TaxID=13335 RepID=UPI002A753E5F|nr:hypothetical protein [Anaerobiospirillum succiniciproducens]MDY2799187.1 hypothetical protein [Anaerobiospirillum succiniciproducens]
MDLSFRKAIEIVLDTLDEPDESVVAKKHNVDVEAVKFFSNDPIIALTARESIYVDSAADPRGKITEFEAMNLYELDKEFGIAARDDIFFLCKKYDVDILEALIYGKQLYETLHPAGDESSCPEEQSSK